MYIYPIKAAREMKISKDNNSLILKLDVKLCLLFEKKYFFFCLIQIKLLFTIFSNKKKLFAHLLITKKKNP